MLSLLLQGKKVKLISNISLNDSAIEHIDPFIVGMEDLHFQPFQQGEKQEYLLSDEKIILVFTEIDRRLYNPVKLKRRISNA